MLNKLNKFTVTSKLAPLSSGYTRTYIIFKRGGMDVRKLLKKLNKLLRVLRI